MKKTQYYLLALLLLLFASSVNNFSQYRTVMITGQAVDENGKPVAKALAELDYPPCSGCIDHLIPGGVAFDDGVFFIMLNSIRVEKFKLYLSDPMPIGFWSPFGSVPYYNLPPIPSLKPRHIYIPYKKTENDFVRLDLGDVVVKTRYSKVIIDLKKVIGEEYKPSQDIMSRFEITIRDNKGRIFFQGGLPQAAYDSTYSFIKLVLVKGKWSLDISFLRDDKMIKVPRFWLNIQKPGCQKLVLEDDAPMAQLCN